MKHKKYSVLCERTERFEAMKIICVLTLFLCCYSLLAIVEGTDLAGGQIITRTDVEDLADIAKDIRDIKHECSTSENYDYAREIYQQGRNAKYSLASFSLLDEFRSGPIHAFQKYGLLRGDLQKESQEEWDETLKWFGHDYILKHFEDEECNYASDAALILNVWMKVASELWEGWDECRSLSDTNYYVDFDPNRKADEFIAYWVGSLQSDLANRWGSSLFSLTNEIGYYFGTLDRNGVAFANQAIVGSYEDASAFLSKPDACSADDTEHTTIKELWKIYNVISSQMLIPLIQLLLRAMIEKDFEGIKLYATIVVPQTSQCRTSTFEHLKANLLDRTYDPANFVELYQSLISTFDCLGIRCDEIGIPKGHSVPICRDSNLVLAEYPPTTEVRQMAKIDLDLHQIDILMKLNEDHFWSMARHIYLYGKNSLKSDNANDDLDDDYYYPAQHERRSIHSIAVSKERTGDLYDAFLDYHNDIGYSDKIIQDTFNGVGKWGNRPEDVRARIIVETIQVQVIYMFIISKLDMAVSQCSDLLWDEAAALIIGTLEGKDKGGSKDFRDGKLLWSLANSRGLDFQRLNDEGHAVVNASVENLLFSGKGKILAGSCANLGQTSKRISHLLLIPVIQSVVKYAISNEFLPPTSLEPGVALGEVNANVIIPIFGMYDTGSAEIIKRNMVVSTFGLLVESGPQSVADTYLKISESFGIECDYIGVRYEVDGCANYKDIMKDPENEDISSVLAVRHLSFESGYIIVVCSLFLLL